MVEAAIDTTDGRMPSRLSSGPHVGDAPLVRLKRPGQIVAAVAIAILIAMIVTSMVTNERYGWGVVAQYLFAPQILRGLLVTIELTVIGMLVGFAFGTVLAVMRLSDNPILKYSSAFYVWLFRGVPLLVQMIILFNLSALYPQLRLVVPFGPELLSVPTNVVLTATVAAILALGLNEAAYMAEIIRAGILSVDQGQMEAAATIGLNSWKTFTKIIFPQAMRMILPPTGNETITMLKITTLASVTAVADLLYSAQMIYARSFETIPMLIMVSIWYLVLVSLLTVGQRHLERHYGRGATRHLPESTNFQKFIQSVARRSTIVLRRSELR